MIQIILLVVGISGLAVSILGLALLRVASNSEQEIILARELAGLYFCATCEWEGDIDSWDGEVCPECGGILQLNPRHPEFHRVYVAAQRSGMLDEIHSREATNA